MLTILIFLTVTFFILTLYSVLQNNLSLFDIAATRSLSLKILDTASAASLFVTLLGALAVRHQFILGFRPRINYNSMVAVKQHLKEDKAFAETWQVRIRNTGLGSAILNRCVFDLETSATKDSDALTFAEIVAALSKVGLERGVDYWLESISNGYALPPKEDCTIFEIKTEYMPKIKHLNMVLHFQGILGDRYNRTIYFMPRKIDAGNS